MEFKQFAYIPEDYRGWYKPDIFAGKVQLNQNSYFQMLGFQHFYLFCKDEEIKSIKEDVLNKLSKRR